MKKYSLESALTHSQIASSIRLSYWFEGNKSGFAARYRTRQGIEVDTESPTEEQLWKEVVDYLDAVQEVENNKKRPSMLSKRK